MKSLVKERPLPFSPDMVLATLKGWKTQTSRTRGLERFNNLQDLSCGPDDDRWEIDYFTEEEPGRWLAISYDETGEFSEDFNPWVKCPYGKTGDRLWVREPWKVGLFLPFGGLQVEYLADGFRRICRDFSPPMAARLKEQSLEDCRKAGVKPWLDRSVLRRRPSMFMPRAASRILLEITDIKLKRLSSIDWREAEAEGIEQIFYDEETSVTGWKNYLDPERMCIRSRDSFFTLWDRINGAGAAEKNPWVWMIKFKVLEK